MFEFSEDYKKYIHSSRWKAVCARYWGAYGKKCQACGARQGLQVHHKSYDRFGRESLSDLTGLCGACHKQVHYEHRRDRTVSLRLVTDRYVALNKKKRK